MPDRGAEADRPSRARMVVATIIVILVVLAVWKVIDYRMRPPPPPNPIDSAEQPPGK
jgi:hypothetical protein